MVGDDDIRRKEGRDIVGDDNERMIEGRKEGIVIKRMVWYGYY